MFQYTFGLIYPMADFVVVSLSIMISYKIYRLLGIGQSVIYQKLDIIPISFLISSAAIFVFAFFDVYKKESSVLNTEEIKNTIKGATVAYTGFMAVAVFGRFDISRYVILFSYVMSIILLVVEKTIFYHLHFLPNGFRRLHKRILIYGAGVLGQTLYREFINSPKFNIIPVGFIDDSPMKMKKILYQSGFFNDVGIPVVGIKEDIPLLMDQMNIDEVYIAISNIEHRKLLGIMDYLKTLKIKAAFVPNLYEIFVHKVKINQVGQIPVVQEADELNGFYLHVKRAMDLLLSVILLIICLDIIAVIAAAIKLSSKGPVFFKQDRVGKDGRIFQIYKFRSMFTDADPYAVNPLHEEDPRITKVGRILRKTSLDELPQIFNVLKGDMSLVGPRPEMPFIVETYTNLHRERLKVLPGITGLWQLSGDRKKNIHENMDYDLYYIGNMSFFLDVAILIETLIFAFKGI